MGRTEDSLANYINNMELNQHLLTEIYAEMIKVPWKEQTGSLSAIPLVKKRGSKRFPTEYPI